MYQIPECLEVCILPHLRGHLQVLRVIIERGELLSSGREKSASMSRLSNYRDEEDNGTFGESVVDEAEEEENDENNEETDLVDKEWSE